MCKHLSFSYRITCFIDKDLVTHRSKITKMNLNTFLKYMILEPMQKNCEYTVTFDPLTVNQLIEHLMYFYKRGLCELLTQSNKQEKKKKP